MSVKLAVAQALKRPYYRDSGSLLDIEQHLQHTLSEEDESMQSDPLEKSVANGAQYSVVLSCQRCYEVIGERPVTVCFAEDEVYKSTRKEYRHFLVTRNAANVKCERYVEGVGELMEIMGESAGRKLWIECNA